MTRHDVIWVVVGVLIAICAIIFIVKNVTVG
jgi:hypothetical protein